MDDRLTKSASVEQTPTGNQRELLETLRRVENKLNGLNGLMFGVQMGEDPEAPPFTPDNWSQLTHASLELANRIDSGLGKLLDRL